MEVREIKLDIDKKLHAYDMSTLFMIVLIDKALEVIMANVEEDNTLRERTLLGQDNIISLLGLCTYIQFQGEYYLQIHGAAIVDHRIAHHVQSIYGVFEHKALAPH